MDKQFVIVMKHNRKMQQTGKTKCHNRMSRLICHPHKTILGYVRILSTLTL